MKEFIKRLVRFVVALVTVLFLPVVFVIELCKWSLECDDSFDVFDGLFAELFEMLTFSRFSLFDDNE